MCCELKKEENNLYTSEVNTLNLCEYLMTDIRLIWTA